MVVYGTRPEAIKVAPLIIGLMDSAVFEPIVVVTAQHRELLDQVNEVFGIKPDADLDIMRPGQTLAEVTIRAISGLDALLSEHRPDAVLVQGDTTTTLAGALTAFYHRVPVVHLEAGLRSGNLAEPFPEEANRSLTGRVADLHLAPTSTSANNLVAEGVPAESIVITGNTVIDALLWSSEAEQGYRHPRLRGLEDGRRLLIVTAHRRESWGSRMEGIGRAVSRLAARERDLHVVFPVHPNPALRRTLLPHLMGHPNVTVTEPLHYADFARLLRHSYLVLTDSGGIQEEAPSLGKPVLVMRDTTERPEALRAGAVRLVGTEENRIVAGVTALLRSPDVYRQMAGSVNPYGDGRATERALAALAHLFGLGPRPEPFRPSRPGHGSLRRPLQPVSAPRAVPPMPPFSASGTGLDVPQGVSVPQRPFVVQGLPGSSQQGMPGSSQSTGSADSGSPESGAPSTSTVSTASAGSGAPSTSTVSTASAGSGGRSASAASSAEPDEPTEPREPTEASEPNEPSDVSGTAGTARGERGREGVPLEAMGEAGRGTASGREVSRSDGGRGQQGRAKVGPRGRSHGGAKHVGLRWLVALLLSALVVSGASLGIFMRKEPGPLPASRTWPACSTAAPAAPGALERGPQRASERASALERATTLVVADDTPGVNAFQVHTTRAANLVSHFGPVEVLATSAYRAGMLRRHRALVYLGISAMRELPAALRQDVLAGSRPVLWMGWNIDRLTTPEDFAARYGWLPGAPDRTQVSSVLFKGKELTRDEEQGPISTFAALDQTRVKVLGTAVTAADRDRPWAVRSANLTYVSEIALHPDTEDDRYLATADVLFDVLDPGRPARHRALVRLEDIGPQSDPNAVREAGEVLSSMGVPFSFGVIPVYRGPLADGRERVTIRLKDRPEVVRALTYLLEHGGTMVLHGYTHQSDGPANPTNGESGHDFEFFRTHFDGNRGLVYDGAIKGDSAAWMERRLDAAVAEVRAARLPVPQIFEIPHYAASPTDYQVIARKFAARYDRGSYFAPGWQTQSPASPYMDEHFAPYVTRDAYGSVVVPETLGMVELEPSSLSEGTGTVESIVDNADTQLVVRDNVASFFYHPFLGTDQLETVVTQLLDLGYQFVAPCAL